MGKDKQRLLDVWGGISLVVGSVLGTGIFVAPTILAGFSDSILVASLFWGLGAAACLAGALIYGNLGLAMPDGGGQFIYLRNTLGPAVSTAYGWSSLFIICPTMLAATALFFADQFKIFGQLSQTQLQLIASITLLAFSLLNTLGIRAAGNVQKLLTVFEVGAFVSVPVLCLFFLDGGKLATYPLSPDWSQITLGKGVFALAVILWSFEGFNAITFVTNEVEDGKRNVRRIAIWGSLSVIGLYTFFNLLVLNHLGPAELGKEANVAVNIAQLAFGPAGTWAVFALMIVAIATTLHTSVIIGPRIIAALAKNLHAMQRFASTSKSTGAPVPAIWLQCVLASACVWIGHFEALITAFIVANWIFYGLTATGYLRLQWTKAKLENRWPLMDCVVVGTFLLTVNVLLVSQFLHDPKLASIGALGLAIWIGGIILWRRWLGLENGAEAINLLAKAPGGRSHPALAEHDSRLPRRPHTAAAAAARLDRSSRQVSPNAP